LGALQIGLVLKIRILPPIIRNDQPAQKNGSYFKTQINDH